MCMEPVAGEELVELAEGEECVKSFYILHTNNRSANRWKHIRRISGLSKHFDIKILEIDKHKHWIEIHQIIYYGT